MSREVELVVNGLRRRVTVGDDELLLDVLRREFDTTSVREGCGVGACGACTVLVGGLPGTEGRRSVSSCLARAARYDGAEISTADGLPEDDDLVESFVQSRAMQCGYCIPGFVLMGHELLESNPAPTHEDVVEHLEGNICRCGTYQEICAAIENTAASRAAAAERRTA
jgi:aerobic-type carbon monoxide dehydrogenase small subunit (CoxS/CutS family)